MTRILARSIRRLALSACVAPFAVHAASPDPQMLETRAAFLQQAADAIRSQARYPATTRALAAGAEDPLRAPYEVNLGSGLEPMFAWASARNLQPGESIDIHARIEGIDDRGHPLDAARARQEQHGAHVSASVIDDSGKTLASLALAEDAAGSNAQAIDGQYSAHWKLPAELAPPPGHARMLRIRIHAVSSDHAVRGSVASVFVSNPGGHLTGQYRDRLEGGNLVVEAQVEIDAPGRFFLAGTLADTSGNLVANGHAAQSFAAPGIYWMNLSYYGLAFVDRSAKGQMTLASVALSGANGMPTAFGPLVENAYRTTVAIDPAKMNHQPFNDPRKLGLARGLEAHIGDHPDRSAGPLVR